MASHPGISIIVPVFNGANYIESTLNSIFANCEGLEFEVIVVNDGSEDETPHLLKRYGTSIRLIEQKNSGEANAVNAGLTLAQYPLVLVLSHDDPCPENRLFHLAFSIFSNTPEVVCVYPDWTILDSKGELVQHVITQEFSKEILLGKFTCLPGPGSIFRAKAAREIGGRDGSWKYVSDYDFWLRLCSLGDFQRIPESLAYWRAHQESTSIKLRSRDMAEERIKVVKDFFAQELQYNKYKSSALCLAYFSAARISYYSTKIPGRRYLLLSFISNPKIFLRQKISHTLFILFSPLSTIIFFSLRKARFSLSRNRFKS
jgi:glycosyltransferase involved in cell wall biosynthesis